MSLLITLIGIIIGLFLMSYSVSQTVPTVTVFLNIPGLEIIFGGLVVITFITYKPNELFVMIKTTMSSFLSKEIDPETLITRFIKYAKLNMAHGYIGLEPEISKLDNCPIVKNALELMIAGYAKEDIQTISTNAAIEHIERMKASSRLMSIFGNAAPGLGMIGTVIGLVVMLHNMNGDMSTIGPAMAVALLTTLYGGLLSTLFFLPMADKIEKKLEVEKIKYKMVLDGILYLSEKRNYVYIKDALSSHQFFNGNLKDNEK